MTVATKSKTNGVTPQSYGRDLRKMAAIGLVTMLVTMLLVFFLLPFAYGTVTAFKTKEQIVNGFLLPMDPSVAIIGDEEYELFNVPMPDGATIPLAMVDKGRSESTFVDPANPTEEILWEGRWRQLDPVMEFSPHPENFPFVWDAVNLPRLFRNTLTIALVGDLGTLISCSLVAYAFARFPIPGKNVLFLLLISTIALPTQVVLVPTYAFFAWIGWTGTWLPLIVPAFFANAYNVFLLRQYFMQLPKEMDEAAMIDGANPFMVFIRIIIPQSWPAIVAIFLFHFVFAWNDYFMPLIYLLGKAELHPISVGIQSFNFIYDQQPQYIQSVSLLALALPVTLFFFSQRFFMQGVVITGVDK